MAVALKQRCTKVWSQKWRQNRKLVSVCRPSTAWWRQVADMQDDYSESDVAIEIKPNSLLSKLKRTMSPSEYLNLLEVVATGRQVFIKSDVRSKLALGEAFKRLKRLVGADYRKIIEEEWLPPGRRFEDEEDNLRRAENIYNWNNRKGVKFKLNLDIPIDAYQQIQRDVDKKATNSAKASIIKSVNDTGTYKRVPVFDTKALRNVKARLDDARNKVASDPNERDPYLQRSLRRYRAGVRRIKSLKGLHDEAIAAAKKIKAPGPGARRLLLDTHTELSSAISTLSSYLAALNKVLAKRKIQTFHSAVSEGLDDPDEL